jgi:UDP:flavonoid glycosyltransferase YjiC (YdhE family)
MRVAFLILPAPGDLNPMEALTRKYRARAHPVVFLSLPEVAPFVQAAQLPFVPCSEGASPLLQRSSRPDHASRGRFHASSKRWSHKRFDLHNRRPRDARRAHRESFWYSGWALPVSARDVASD